MFNRIAAIPRNFFSADGSRLSPLAYAFLILLCLAFFTPGLVTLPPTDRDESSFAQASKQMIESGDYTDIRLQDQPRYKKPIGIYWLQSASARLLNPHHLNEIWAYRIPSLIGATIAVVMTAALGSLLFGPVTGLLAAMMLAACVLLNVEARLAKTDAALLGSIMVAMYGLARAYMRTGNRERGTALPQARCDSLPLVGRVREGGLPQSQSTCGSSLLIPLLFWTALAFGILIKGPIILLPIGAVLIGLRISEGNLAWFRTLRPILGIPYALAFVAPWFIAISLHSHGDFLHQSAGNDMLAKIWQGQNRGIMWPGLHLLALPIMFFPFSLFVLLAVPDAWKNRHNSAVRFLLWWIAPTWIVFELSLTKLPHYVLPAYPALAILAAKYALDGFPTIATRRLPTALLVMIWIMVGAGFGIGFALLPSLADNRFSVEQSAAGIVLMVTQAVALLLLLRRRAVNAVIALTVGGLIFMTATFGDTLPTLPGLWLSRDIVETVAPLKPCAQTQIVTLGYGEPSLVFLAGTDTLLTKDAGAAANALRENHCRVGVISNKYRDDFLKQFSGDEPKPQDAAQIDGLNSGHGSTAQLRVYVMPSTPNL